MYRYKKELKKASGFTIIEVMIVLAVAGLIMAIVFLAVPALQRNNRNTQRSSDASRVLAAIGECLAAKNGQLSSCNTTALLDPAYITFANNQQLTTGAIAASIPATTVLNTINIGFGQKCNDAGDAMSGGGGTRAYAVGFRIESANGDTTRCIAS